jgi:putative transposase
VWSFDFCHDRAADGRRLKIFSVIDEFTRQCLTIEVHRRITGTNVVRVLDALDGAARGARAPALRQRPGVHLLGGEELAGACDGVGVVHCSRKPVGERVRESYHARLRDEMLDREEFATLAEARALLAAWREQYDQERPHSSLGYQTPEAFAAACRAEACSATLRRPRNDGEDEEKVAGNCCAGGGIENGGRSGGGFTDHVWRSKS